MTTTSLTPRPLESLTASSRATDLRRLYLGFLIIDQGAPVPCLPQLEELYIRRSALSLDMAKEWLQAERLPALLVLHCVGVQIPRPDKPWRSPTRSPQISCLSSTSYKRRRNTFPLATPWRKASSRPSSSSAL